MAENKQIDKTTVVDSSRRSILTKLWSGLGLLAVLQTAWVVVAYLRPHSTKSKDDKLQSIVKAGPAESFPLDSVTVFIKGKFYLSRSSKTFLLMRAFLARC